MPPAGQTSASVASAVRELSAPARRQDGLEPDQVTYALLEALIPSRAAYLRDEASLAERCRR